jgi:hypothetical protein
MADTIRSTYRSAGWCENRFYEAQTCRSRSLTNSDFVRHGWKHSEIVYDSVLRVGIGKFCDVFGISGHGYGGRQLFGGEPMCYPRSVHTGRQVVKNVDVYMLVMFTSRLETQLSSTEVVLCTVCVLLRTQRAAEVAHSCIAAVGTSPLEHHFCTFSFSWAFTPYVVRKWKS